jgi:L-fuculose-phosphate aldolase|nr:MAG: aldolase [Bacteroidota bacterium]
MSDVRLRLLRVAHRLYRRGLAVAWDGNVSVRASEETIWITPAGRNKGELRIEDLVLVDLEGRVLEGRWRPSSELGMHMVCYRTRPEVGAVVHAHPPYATAFAVARQEIPTNVLPEMVVRLGSVPLVPYATPGTWEVAEALRPWLGRGSRVFLLANHGVTTLGSTVEEAYYLLEKLEHAARVLWLARALGGAVPLRQAEELRLLQLYGRGDA